MFAAKIILIMHLQRTSDHTAPALVHESDICRQYVDRKYCQDIALANEYALGTQS
jgi:hypothetical protein